MFRTRYFFSLLILSFFCFPVTAQKTSAIWLDDLTIKAFSEGIPAVLGKTNAGGDSMRIAGQTFQHGVGVNATSILSFLLEKNAVAFSAQVGVDDLGSKTLTHKFYVLGDKKILFESTPMKWGDKPQLVQVDLKGISRMGLLVLVQDKGHTKVYSNWANARLVMKEGTLPKKIPNDADRYILTPPSSPVPRINSPKVMGARPGNPFLYAIAATGERPLIYDALQLPGGLQIDRQTGIITGSISNTGKYEVVLRASNRQGIAEQHLRITIGDTISLTPPMGWNGWNSWAREIDQEKVIASAKAMVKMGLKDHGWTYINIDDAWQGKRGGKYNAIQPNEKFPGFKSMIDSIHGMGLKLGVYATPWITSYAGYPGGSSDLENGDFPDSVRDNKRAFRYIGKYRFEKEDALQMAAWGVDYLKYDWRIDVSSAERMSTALKQSGRDIVYSLSNSAPFEHVKDWVRIANLYRTGPDIRDSWHGLYQTTFTLDKWGPYGGPGHWNDPDMMIVGNVTTGSPMHPTRLTPDEQYSHVSLFALLSAPMLIGCPIEQLDAFTLNLLTNDEVIAIDQDPLGKSARLVKEEQGVQTWLKPLEDGSYAVGFFNVGDYGKTPQSYFRWGDEKEKPYAVSLSKLGLSGKWVVRDVWRQKNTGVQQDRFDVVIRHHGVQLFRLIPYATADTVWLDDLSIQSFSEGIRPVKQRTNYQGDSIKMGGKYFSRGIGLQSISVMPFQLNGKGLRFKAVVGSDEKGNKDIPIRFHVLGDGKILFQSREMKVGDAPQAIDLDIRGVGRLGLLVTDEIGGISNKRTYGNWADAQLLLQQGHRPMHVPNAEKAVLLTPPVSAYPRINAAKVVGARPGHPFLFTIAASGSRPMQYSAEGLPGGLVLDSKTGIISGVVNTPGSYQVSIKVKNQLGEAMSPLRMRIGDTIALTPPIGWNGWNSWAHALDKEKVIASAEAMVRMGLADHGWTYINIDDTWQGVRGGPLNALQPNEKFQGMKEMVDRIHAMGLKAGLYSTPYISSYAGFPGASSDYPAGGETHELIRKNRQPFMRIGPHRFEENDAKQMAEWGFDFLKYDWRIDALSSERMFNALKKSGRDIILSLSNSAPFDKVNDWVRTSNMYRTGPDIRDSWNSLYMTTFTLDKWGPTTGPGHWADPDMMILGNVTTGQSMHPTRLTPHEQYSHVSMNALLSAPMLIGCPIEQLDSFTLNLLTNDEVIEIDQDALGRAARFIREENGVQVWLKTMEDGSYAVGLFNTDHYGKTPQSYFRWGNEKEKSFAFYLNSIGLNGQWQVRDVWRQRDLGTLHDKMEFNIPHHGVVLLRLQQKQNAMASSGDVKANPVVPVVADPEKRKELLQQQWKALHQAPPQIGVRDCFLFLLDALDANFLTQEEVLWTIQLVKTRLINDKSKPSYGNAYWGWTETGGDVGDGNNIQFCVQYGIPIKLLFNDRLSISSRKELDDLFSLASEGVNRLKVRISYTNIYVMRIWNLIALGQVYKNDTLLKEGYSSLDAWLKHIAQYGNREYDSPTYSGVDMESLLLLYRFSNDPVVKNKVFDAIQFFITDLCAHYNARGGYLEGAHSRDYNRVFGRDLLEEKYFNPLLRDKSNNIQLFHQLCFSILKDIGLNQQQKELMHAKDKFIIQRWDSLAHTYTMDYHGKKFSMASSNQYYSPDDKSFVAYLSSDRIPAMPNIVYVAEGRNDHYGTWSLEGKGDKFKHLMPANYPSNGGWNKTRHLMPFMQTVQNKNEFVMLVLGEKDHNCINPYLNSTVILPNYFDEVWMGNKKMTIPAEGGKVSGDSSRTLFARFEDVAIAIRILWSNAAKETLPVLYNDGFRFVRPGVLDPLQHNQTLRLTVQHPDNGKLGIAMWWKIVEGIDSDKKFTAFRNEVLHAPLQLTETNGIIDLAIATKQGKLGLKADLIKKERLSYYSPSPMPTDFLLQVNGREIGKPIIAKYK